MLRLPILLLAVFLTLGALAQQPPLPLPTPPLPAPAPRTVAPAATGAVDGPVRLDFPGSDVKEVLQYYELLAKKKLIYDVQAIGTVNIVVKDNLTVEEAKRIIEISMLMNGFTLVEDKDFIKVLGTGRNPRGFGIPIIFDEDKIPEKEEVVTYVFKLHHADPTEVATVLSQYTAPSTSGYSQTLALPKANSVLVTENSLVIRSLFEIVRQIDTPPADVSTEFIRLERADAKEVLEKLEKLFEKPQTGAGGAAAPANGLPRSAPRVATTPDGLPVPQENSAPTSGPTIEISANPSEESLIVGKIKLSADTRTNRIFVVTRLENFPFIHKLIREFDADVPFGDPVERHLKNVFAGDILDTIVTAVTEPGQKQEGGQGGGASRGSSTNRNTGTSSTDAFSRNSNFSNNSNSGFGQSGVSGGSSGGFSESLSTEERDIIPETRIINNGSTKIIADKRDNKIMVLGNREIKEKIFAIIDKLDVRAPQVMINTVIGELTLNSSQSFGVTYILNNGSRKGLLGATVTGGNGTGTGTGTGTGDGTGTGSAAAGTGALTIGSNNSPTVNLSGLLLTKDITKLAVAGAGGFSGFIAAGNSFNAIVDALESSDRFKVVSRPSIFTSNNKKAVIASGEEIAVPVSVTGGFTGSNVATGGLVTQSNIQFKNVQLKLEVRPLINSDREVTLDIVQAIDQQSGSTIIDGNSIPRISTRSLQTTVTVPNGGTLALGGLIKQSDDKGKTGIPVLSRLPLVGPLFGRTTRDKIRTELVILLRPVVTLGPDEDVRQRERAMEALHIEPDLEATVYPTNLRRKERFDPNTMVRQSAPVLRETSTATRVSTDK